MDKRELLPFQTLVNSLDTDYGKRTPKHLATIRFDMLQNVAVKFRNKEATIKGRLLIDRISRNQRKIRIFLEDGDIVVISRIIDDFEKVEYYRAEQGIRNIRLVSIAGPTLDEVVDKRTFERLEDGRLSLVCRTFNRAVSVLAGLPSPNILAKLTTLAGVNLIFEKQITNAVSRRCNWFVPAYRVWPALNKETKMCHWANPNFKDLTALDIPLDEYLVGIDADTLAIRVLAHPDAHERIIKFLYDKGIYSHAVDNVHRLLIDPSSDLVHLGFEEK